MRQQQKETMAFDADEFVCDYLLDHTAFFEAHIDLLIEMKVPHPCGTSVSLVERQLTALRSDNKKLSTQLMSLISIAKENDHVNQQIDQLTLTLFEAKTLDDVFQIIEDSLMQDFEADQIALKLFTTDSSLTDSAHFYPTNDPSAMCFEYFLKTGKPSCGRLNAEQKQSLFGADWEAIQSCALIPINNEELTGFLAIGSNNETRYHPGRGTTFLGHLGLLLSKVIQIHLQKPAEA